MNLYMNSLQTFRMISNKTPADALVNAIVGNWVKSLRVSYNIGFKRFLDYIQMGKYTSTRRTFGRFQNYDIWKLLTKTRIESPEF